MATPIIAASSSQRRVSPVVMIGGIESLDRHGGGGIEAHRSSGGAAAPVISGPLPPSPPSDAESEAPSQASQSWACPHCSYRNVDPKNEKCALCGVRDQRHVVDYQRAKKRRHARSYSWLSLGSCTEGGAADHAGGRESAPAASPLAPPAISEPGPKPSQPQMSKQTAAAEACTSPRRQKGTGNSASGPVKKHSTPNDDPSSPSKTKKKGSKKLSVSEPAVEGVDKKGNGISNGHLRMENDGPEATGSSHSRPRRPDKFDEQSQPASPNKRPPKSPASKGTPVISGEDSRMIATGFCVGSRDALQVMRTLSETSSMVVLPGERLFPDADCTDASVTDGSISSFSTVRASNTQLNGGSGDGNPPPTSLAKMLICSAAPVNTDAVLSQWILSNGDRRTKTCNASPTSMKAPNRSNSSPPNLARTGASNSQEDRPAAGKIRQYHSEITRSAIYTVHEDTEQASSPPLQQQQCHSLAPSDAAHLATHAASAPSDSNMIPFFGTKTNKGSMASSSDKNSPAEHREEHDRALDTLESQADDPDRQQQQQQQQQQQRQQKSILGRKRPSWMVWTLVGGVIVLGVVIAMSIILLAKDGLDSSNQFQVGMDPTQSPVSADTPISIPTDDVPPTQVSLPPRDEALEGADEAASTRHLQLIAVETGQVTSRLGSSVAIGGLSGEIWVAMLGDGFVRVVEVLSAASENALSVTTGETSGGAVLKAVGSDISIPSEKGVSQLAMASVGRRLATIVSGGLLSIYEFDSTNNTGNAWDTLQSNWTSADDILQGDSEFTPTSVSVSADGRYVATASISPTVRGDYLMLQVLEVESTQPAASYGLLLEEPRDGSRQEAVRVEISNDGSTLIVCTKDDVLVKHREIGDGGHPELVSMGGQPVLPLGVTVTTCALSGDGSRLGVTLTTSSSTGATVIFAYQESEWWQEDAAILASGAALSFDYTGDLMALGDSTDGDGIISVWSRSNDGNSSSVAYKLLDQIIGGKDTREFGASVALSKRLEQEGNELLVVGAPSGGKENDGSVHVYEIV